MRKIVVGAFVSLDGIMQAPGGPEDDTTGGFRYGGWTVPFWDDVTGAAMGETFSVPVAESVSLQPTLRRPPFNS